MNQTFRQDIDSIPSGSFSDMRERCRLRVLDFMKAQRASTHHCIYCRTLLLTTEISGFCCGKSQSQTLAMAKAVHRAATNLRHTRLSFAGTHVKFFVQLFCGLFLRARPRFHVPYEVWTTDAPNKWTTLQQDDAHSR